MRNDTAAAALLRLRRDVWAALEILAAEGNEDSPLAAFLRAALVKAGGRPDA